MIIMLFSETVKRDVIRKLSNDWASGKSESRWFCTDMNTALIYTNFLSSFGISASWAKSPVNPTYVICVDLYANHSAILKASCNYKPTMPNV